MNVELERSIEVINIGLERIEEEINWIVMANQVKDIADSLDDLNRVLKRTLRVHEECMSQIENFYED